MRALCGALSASAAVPGLWATTAARSFFDRFPGLGLGHWVAALPPYNEHLTRDVGAFYLAFALLFAWAAVRPHRALLAPLALAWSLFGVLHLIGHLSRPGDLSAGQATAQAGALLVVLSAGVLLVRRPR